jgi:prepilin-type N-terminal cleavage/methylation domain-containing protein
MKNNKNGFTLVEAIVASAILAITAGAIFSTLSWGRIIIFQNRCHQEASQIAFDELWNVFNMRWEEMKSYEANPNVQNVYPGTLLSDYNGTIATAVYDNGNTYTITVQVDWENLGAGFSGLSSQETFKIVRCYSNRGL